MNNKTYIGIDNGVTGTIGIMSPDGNSIFIKTPVKKEQSYTKKKGNVSRIIASDLFIFLSDNLPTELDGQAMCLIERPMVNPKRWAASVSAIRALEATLIIVELLEIPYIYVDSKEWQRELLPKGCKGDALKTASKDIGCRLFPQHKELIIKHKDADGILMAEYARRKF